LDRLVSAGVLGVAGRHLHRWPAQGAGAATLGRRHVGQPGSGVPVSFPPPLITTGKLAPWVLVRDFVLTLMAWMVLIWLMRHLLLVPSSGIGEGPGNSARVTI